MNEAYRSGFTHSFIVHATAVLILSLIVIQPESYSRPIALALKVDSAHDADNVSELRPVAQLFLHTESSEGEREDGAAAQVHAAFDLSPGAAISPELENMLPLEKERTTDHFDLVTTDLLVEVRSPRSKRMSQAVLRGPTRGTQAASRGNGNAGGGVIGGALGGRLQADKATPFL